MHYTVHYAVHYTVHCTVHCTVHYTVHCTVHYTVHYSALRRTWYWHYTVHYSACHGALQCITAHCSALQCITVHYTVHDSALHGALQCIAVHLVLALHGALQCMTRCITVHYSALQCAWYWHYTVHCTVHYSAWQCTWYWRGFVLSMATCLYPVTLLERCSTRPSASAASKASSKVIGGPSACCLRSWACQIVLQPKAHRLAA